MTALQAAPDAARSGNDAACHGRARLRQPEKVCGSARHLPLLSALVFGGEEWPPMFWGSPYVVAFSAMLVLRAVH
jgi:hypothetical protein